MKNIISVAVGLWFLDFLPAEKVASAVLDEEADVTNDPAVLIIGAGVAGLSAAWHLKQKGISSVILEARNRIGGRIWTDRTTFQKPLDLGATWIHGVTKNPITELAKKQKISIVQTNDDREVVYQKRGQKITQDRVEWIMQRLDDIVDEVAEWVDQSSDDPKRSLQNAFDQVLRKHRLSSAELQKINFAIRTVIEQEYATDLSRLSALYWDRDAGFDGGDAIFPNGYDQIITYLAKGLAIRTETVVKEIVRGDQVTVITDRGTFTSDRVLVTVPLGVLKKGSIRFKPALPERKKQAIDHLEMGVLNKIYLQFPRVFWDKHADWIKYVGVERGSTPEFFNLFPYTKQPILLGFNAGNFAKKVEGLSDKDATKMMMNTLQAMYGTKIPSPIRTRVTRWSSDPFSCGSYSFNAVQMNADDREALAESIEDQLYFAGEATSEDHFATVHGAYLSGIRAAEQMMRDGDE